MNNPKIPDRLSFKISEVAEIVGVKPYVLRYWESEFEIISPSKSKANQRVYERKDIEKVLLIKKLLYEDMYTIAGAKKRLKEGKTVLLKEQSESGKQTEKLEVLQKKLREFREFVKNPPSPNL